MTIDFRDIIRRHLEHCDVTVYWLGQQDDTPTANTIYRYLRGEIDLRGENLAAILNVLGASISDPPSQDGKAGLPRDEN